MKRNLEDFEVADMEEERLGDGERRWGSVGSTGSTGSATRSGGGGLCVGHGGGGGETRYLSAHADRPWQLTLIPQI